MKELFKFSLCGRTYFIFVCADAEDLQVNPMLLSLVLRDKTLFFLEIVKFRHNYSSSLNEKWRTYFLDFPCYGWYHLLKCKKHKNESTLCPWLHFRSIQIWKIDFSMIFIFFYFTTIQLFSLCKFSPLLLHWIVKGNKRNLFLYTNKPI